MAVAEIIWLLSAAEYNIQIKLILAQKGENDGCCNQEISSAAEVKFGSNASVLAGAGGMYTAQREQCTSLNDMRLNFICSGGLNRAALRHQSVFSFQRNIHQRSET